MINSRFLFLAAFLLAGICIASPASATTCANSSYPAAQLTGMVSGTAIHLNWNAITDPGFQGYKVVISKNSASPRYPDDGYLYFITDSGQNSATVDGTATYNGGDIGGHLQPGVTYHFSVTTLYCDRTIPGNAISLTFPGTVEPVPTTAATPVPTATSTPVATATTTPAPTTTATPVVTAIATPVPTQSPSQVYRAPVVQGTAVGDHIRLTWNRITDPRLLGYRVVASQYDLAPVYPDDGYLYWITDLNQNFAMIDNSTPYHGGDIGADFQPGISYTFSVTAVYTDGNVAGNGVRLNYPSAQQHISPQQGDYPVPDLTGTADSGHIRLNWNDNADRRILGYKVLISRTNPDPRYDWDGDAALVTGRDQHSATFDMTSYYNSGDFRGRLRPGTYYVRVIAIYQDRIVNGRVIRITVPEIPVTGRVTTVPTKTPVADYTVPQVTGTVDGSVIRLNWNVITDNRFQGYKVVISKNNPSPKYPDDGYLFYITDRNQHSATVGPTMTYNGGDFRGHLVPGETYHFSITALYPGHNVAGNAVTLVCPGTTTPVPTTTTSPTISPTTIPTTIPTTEPVTTVTTAPVETTPTPTPEVTAIPTRSVYDLIEEQNRKIDAQSMLIAEQNKKLTVQSGILDRLLALMKSIFRF